MAIYINIVCAVASISSNNLQKIQWFHFLMISHPDTVLKQKQKQFHPVEKICLLRLLWRRFSFQAMAVRTNVSATSHRFHPLNLNPSFWQWKICVCPSWLHNRLGAWKPNNWHIPVVLPWYVPPGYWWLHLYFLAACQYMFVLIPRMRNHYS